jgi:hypothetical protein
VARPSTAAARVAGQAAEVGRRGERQAQELLADAVLDDTILKQIASKNGDAGRQP